MFHIEMTPQLLGFKVSGCYDDLDELYDAIWALTIAEDDFQNDKRMRGNFDEQLMSTRLLALNYDLRHAYQGSRGIELVPSGMHEWDAEYREMPFVEKNVAFSVEILYPEAMYEALALSYFASKMERLLGGSGAGRGGQAVDKVAFNSSISLVRVYLCRLMDAVKKQATPGRYARIAKSMADGFYLTGRMYQQWVDILNNDYAGMTRKQRAESLSTIVRDLTEYWRHEQYADIVADVDRFAKEHDITRDHAEITGLYGWDELEW